MKKALARKIANRMSDKQKKQVLDAFYHKNKNRDDVDKLMSDMKKMLNYKENE